MVSTDNLKTSQLKLENYIFGRICPFHCLARAKFYLIVL
jgi:hypothetical protein